MTIACGHSQIVKLFNYSADWCHMKVNLVNTDKQFAGRYWIYPPCDSVTFFRRFGLFHKAQRETKPNDKETMETSLKCS